MVSTVKFSQFPNGGPSIPGDIFVGLRGGVNTQFTTGGGGGGAGVTLTVMQTGHGLTLGQWIRLNGSGLYVTALGDNAGDAEAIGVVINVISPNEFIMQQSGYITSAQAVFTSLTTGSVYFLDTVTPGNMVITDALINGQVSRPVFVPDTPTSGWVLPYRGLIVGGAAPPSPNPNPNVVTITQNAHGLTAGQVVYLSASITYTPANATALATSQAVGVVTSVINANQFVLQTEGYFTITPSSNTGPFSVDDMGNPLVAGTVYYLSTVTGPSGRLTSTDPSLSGSISKPIYVAEQVFGTTGTNAGYILPQRPISATGGAAVGMILLATQTASGSPSIISFNGIFSSLYNNYIIVWNNVTPTVNTAGLVCQIGTGAGPVYQNTNYSGVGYTVGFSGLQFAATLTTSFFMGTTQYNTPTFGAGGQALLTNVNSTNYKYFQSDSTDTSTIYSANVRSTTSQTWAGIVPLTSIQIFFNSGNILSGTFSIYGLNR